MNLADALYDFASFRAAFAEYALPDVILSDTDIRVLLKFLQRDRKVLVSDNEVSVFSNQFLISSLTIAGQVIKFVADANDLSEITAVDHGILELKTALGNLHAQVESLQGKIETCVLSLN